MVARQREHLEEKIQGVIEKLQNNIIDDYLETFLSYIYSEPATILDYIDGVIFLDEPSRIREGYDTWLFEFQERFKHNLEQGEVLPQQAHVFLPYDHMLSDLQSFKK